MAPPHPSPSPSPLPAAAPLTAKADEEEERSAAAPKAAPKADLRGAHFVAVLWLRALLARRDFRAIFSAVFFPLLNIAIAAGTSAAFQSSVPSFPDVPVVTPVALIPDVRPVSSLSDSSILTLAAIFQGDATSAATSSVWSSQMSPALLARLARLGSAPDRTRIRPFASPDDFALANRKYNLGDPSEPDLVYGGWRFNDSSLAALVANTSGSAPSSDWAYTVITASGQASILPALLANLIDQAELDLIAAAADPATAAAARPGPRINTNASTFVTHTVVDVPSQIVPIFLVNGLTFLTGYFAEARVRENELGLQNQLFVSGIVPAAFYGATFLADILLYLWSVVSTCVFLGISAAVSGSMGKGDSFRFFTQPSLAGYILPMLCFGPSLILSGYLLSFRAKKGSSIAALTGIGQSVVVFVPYFFLQLVAKNNITPVTRYLLTLFLPVFGLTHAFLIVAQSVQGTQTPMTTRQVFDPSQSDILPICLTLLLQGALLLLFNVTAVQMRLTNTGLLEFIRRLFQKPTNGRAATPTKRVEPFDDDLANGTVTLTVSDDDGTDGTTAAGSTESSAFPVDAELERHVAHLKATASADGTMWGEEAALRVEGIGKDVDGTKLFGKKLTVLKDLWFSANVGECFGFLGPNGAGKSTTIRILTGQEPPTSGTAHLPPYTANHPITALTPYPHARLRSHIGLCPQHDALWDKLTPRDHVWLFGVIRGVVAVPTSLLGWLRRGKRQTDEEVETWLEKVAIATADRDVLSQKLSGGNRRRLMLAVAAVGRPRVLFLDEPTTGVDVAVRRSIWSAIQDLKKTSCVVLTTHSMEEADALSTRIGILVAGRLRCLGSPQRLKSVYSSGYTVTMHPPTAAAASTRQDAASAAAAAELAGEATARRLAAAIVARAAGLGLAAGTADAVTATPERGVGSVWVVRVGWAAAAAIVGADLLAGDGDGGSRDRAMAVRALTLLEAIHAAIEDRGAWAADATDAGDVGVAQTTLKQVFNEFSKRGDALQNATN